MKIFLSLTCYSLSLILIGCAGGVKPDSSQLIGVWRWQNTYDGTFGDTILAGSRDRFLHLELDGRFWLEEDGESLADASFWIQKEEVYSFGMVNTLAISELTNIFGGDTVFVVRLVGDSLRLAGVFTHSDDHLFIRSPDDSN